MGREFPRHWDMTNLHKSIRPAGFVRLDIYESVLANGTGGCIFNNICVRNPSKIKDLRRGGQNAI